MSRSVDLYMQVVDGGVMAHAGILEEVVTCYIFVSRGPESPYRERLAVLY